MQQETLRNLGCQKIERALMFRQQSWTMAVVTCLTPVRPLTQRLCGRIIQFHQNTPEFPDSNYKLQDDILQIQKALAVSRNESTLTFHSKPFPSDLFEISEPQTVKQHNVEVRDKTTMWTDLAKLVSLFLVRSIEQMRYIVFYLVITFFHSQKPR